MEGKYILVVLTGLTLEMEDTRRWADSPHLRGDHVIHGLAGESVGGGCPFQHPDYCRTEQSFIASMGF